MIFLYPAVLWMLVALAIPIIIHLFNFRKYKKIYFSNVAFLKDIQTESEKKSKLKHLLTLLARLLAFASLVVAFSQPFIPTGNEQKVTDVSIYIDNSLSLEAKNEQGTLLEQAKQLALSIADNHTNDVRFLLITNDFFGKHTHTLSKSQMKTEIDAIDYSPFSKDFSSVINRQQQLALGSKLFMISDFQKSQTIDFSKLDDYTSVSLFQIEATNASNIYIDSIWFAAPNHTKFTKEQLYVKLVNSSENSVETRVELILNNVVKGFTNVSMEENSQQTIEFSYDNSGLGNTVTGKVALSDYPSPTLLFDDELYFAYQLSNSIKVGIIHEQSNSSKLIENVYRVDSAYSVTAFNNLAIDYDALSKQHLIILNELESIPTGLANQLESYSKNGVHVLIIPSQKIDNSSYSFLHSKFGFSPFTQPDSSSVRVKTPDKAQPFFSNMFTEVNTKMDMPKIVYKYGLSNTNSNTETVVSFENNQSFLLRSKQNKGQAYVFSFPFSKENNTFKSHALFVPIMLRIAELSGASYDSYYTLNKPIVLSTNITLDNSSTFTITSKSNNLSFIPNVNKNQSNTQAIINDEIKQVGFYDLIYKDTILQKFAVNYNRSESALTYYDSKALINLANEQQKTNVKLFEVANNYSAKEIISQEKGKSLWVYFIFAAILFFLIEILLIRFLK